MRHPRHPGGRATLGAGSQMGRVARRGPEPDLGAVLAFEIPDHPVETRGVAAPQGAHHRTGRVEDGNAGCRFRRALEPVVDRRAVGGILPGGGVVVCGGWCGDGPEAPGLPDREEMGRLAQHLRGHLLERGDVVHDPEAAPVGRDHQVVEPLLHHDAGDRGVGQVGLKREPPVAGVERDVDGVLGAQVEQPGTHRIFGNRPGVAQPALRDPGHDQGPAAALVAGPVDERVAAVDLMEVHHQIRGRGIVVGGDDGPDRSPRRKAREAGGEVAPAGAVVPGELDLAVVGADPDGALREGRFGDGVEGAGILDADVIAREAARASLAALVIQGEVGTDDLPALSAIPGAVEVLAPDIHRVVVVR